MKEMPSLSKPVQRLKVATLPLDLPCSGPVTHSGEIFNHWQVSRKETGQQHVNRMPRDRLPRIMKHYSPIGRRKRGRPLKRLLDT